MSWMILAFSYDEQSIEAMSFAPSKAKNRSPYRFSRRNSLGSWLTPRIENTRCRVAGSGKNCWRPIIAVLVKSTPRDLAAQRNFTDAVSRPIIPHPPRPGKRFDWLPRRSARIRSQLQAEGGGPEDRPRGLGRQLPRAEHVVPDDFEGDRIVDRVEVAVEVGQGPRAEIEVDQVSPGHQGELLQMAGDRAGPLGLAERTARDEHVAGPEQGHPQVGLDHDTEDGLDRG